MITEGSLVDIALLQYTQDAEFRTFVDDSITIIQRDNPQLRSDNLQQLIAMQVNQSGQLLAQVLLNKWMELDERGPCQLS